ncbi:MAG: phosphate signaling complex protein PhoU [Proteobacteria bacterium]|jgi:phosphate transport system protein|nr:phosphate signaling complex protein PhoU [Pseudomonadota bacterium]MDA1301719.1 phosphate signaling complex protein PhoU [Pseudomonadota bacterium]
MSGDHTVKSYDQELQHLNDLVLRIGNLARDQLQRAVDALKARDPDAARDMIARDALVNDLDIEVDDHIVHVIGKRQPMGPDLREILTVGKVVTDLERVGDEARKVAMLCLHFCDGAGSSSSELIVRDLIDMADSVDGMLDKAIRAFAGRDLKLAVECIRLNVDLDSEFRSGLEQLAAFIREDPHVVGDVVETVLGLRAITRIGGHAKNIGGYVVFLVKGKDVRHEDLEAVAAEVESPD